MGQNRIVIMNFVKLVFGSIFSLISYLLNKIKSLIRNYDEKRWSIFKFIKVLDS